MPRVSNPPRDFFQCRVGKYEELESSRIVKFVQGLRSGDSRVPVAWDGAKHEASYTISRGHPVVDCSLAMEYLAAIDPNDDAYLKIEGQNGVEITLRGPAERIARLAAPILDDMRVDLAKDVLTSGKRLRGSDSLPVAGASNLYGTLTKRPRSVVRPVGEDSKTVKASAPKNNTEAADGQPRQSSQPNTTEHTGEMPKESSQPTNTTAHMGEMPKESSQPTNTTAPTDEIAKQPPQPIKSTATTDGPPTEPSSAQTTSPNLPEEENQTNNRSLGQRLLDYLRERDK